MSYHKDNEFTAVLNIMKALNDRNRLRTFMVLNKGELCVCQIVELLRLAPSTVSKHLAVLYQSGLLRSHKKGRWVYYHISEDVLENYGDIINPIINTLNNDPVYRDDLSHLEKILMIDPEKLCRMQSGR